MWVTPVLLVLAPAALGQVSSRRPPEFPGLQSIEKLASAGGSRITNYEVVTEDGYYLWLHRLGNSSGHPVLIQHGLGYAADVWIARDPKKSLPFMLLQRGFDVWLSNQRGTVYNERHVKYPRSDPRFWDFSFHEAGYYDMPAFIDTVLKIRGREKLYYIGHSRGATVFLVMASTRPEYNSKVQAAVLLSPVAYLPTVEELTPPLRLIRQFGDGLLLAAQRLGQYELGRRTEASISFLKKFCGQHAPTQKLCFIVFGVVFGNSEATVDKKEWEQNQPYFGAGASLKTIQHYLQVSQSGEFKQFDYGPKMNLIKYNNKRPPKYDLGLVTAPVVMVWSRNDPLLSNTSLQKLSSQLPNVIYSQVVADPSFSHIDMYIGADADKLVYSDIINVLSSLSRS